MIERQRDSVDTECPGEESQEASTDGGYVTSEQTATVEATQTANSGGRLTRPRQIAVLAHLEYRLAIRSRWAYALTALFALFGLMLATFSGSAVGPEGLERIVASLASLAVYLIPLAALAFGYDTVVGRDEEGWLAVVFSLPVYRWQVVLGGFAGRALVLATATVVGFSAVGALLLRDYGLAYWHTFIGFLLAAVGLGLAFLAIAVFVSSLARVKTHALGLVLLVWLWFVIIHDLLALGIVAALSLPETILTALVLANPADVFRVLVLSQLDTTAGGGIDAAVAETGLSIGLLLGSLLAWILIPLAAGAYLVRRRRVSK